MANTSLESSEFTIFEKRFFGYHLGYHVWLLSHICTLCWYIFNSEIEMNEMNLRTVWVPFWYPKNLRCKIWNQSLQTPYLTCKYKILARSYNILKFDVFAWFQSIKKHSQFKFVKTHAKHQASKYCKILLRFYTYMWDMAFEGFDFKFCNTNFFGYHNGTHTVLKFI